MKFRTESGSIYVINCTETLMTWARLAVGDPKHTSRKNAGRLLVYPNIVVGEAAYLQDDDIKPGCIAHFVRTSPVVQIYDEVPR